MVRHNQIVDCFLGRCHLVEVSLANFFTAVQDEAKVLSGWEICMVYARLTCGIGRGIWS